MKTEKSAERNILLIVVILIITLGVSISLYKMNKTGLTQTIINKSEKEVPYTLREMTKDAGYQGVEGVIAPHSIQTIVYY